MRKALIIFVKNPELGKVKTRLAATVGDQKALEIYIHLMEHTKKVALEVETDRYLFYSQSIAQNDMWPKDKFEKHLQHIDPNLGLKMFSAFSYLLEKEYDKALIIGSDCLDITSEIINNAYKELDNSTAVIGPAYDGGYYSIGFNFQKLQEQSVKVLTDVFLNKEWSHEDVCAEAIAAFKKNKLRYFQMPTLSDVDYEEDVKHLL
ncbi:TIGR04282 family arsenosugar biosynthesis glycosyltransferase [Jiulongibacter sp. NS-SX5]|uniref:TIGR04282 family arsenosugar biosynthesis glycosyltransferase n=1 Tax=Jiulongibacter sp. NS-SX5 TaxID=3463854 RepID=UPI0040580A4E